MFVYIYEKDVLCLLYIESFPTFVRAAAQRKELRPCVRFSNIFGRLLFEAMMKFDNGKSIEPAEAIDINKNINLVSGIGKGDTELLEAYKVL